MRRIHGLLVVLCAVALPALVASAAAPRARDAAAGRRPQPDYLQPVGGLVQRGVLPSAALIGEHGTVGVPSGTPPPAAAPDPGTAARQGPVIARYQGAPGTLRPFDIATLALEHGCAPNGAVTATAIAMAESGGSPSAQGDIGLMTQVWDWSAGLWQIRGLRAERNTGGLRDSVANQDVDRNAAAMHTISLGCTDWAPWSTYGNGDYLPFMALAEQAVRHVVAYYEAHGHFPPVAAPDPTAVVPSQGAGGGATTASARQAKHASRHRAPARSGSATSSGAAQPSPTPTPAPQPTSSSPGGGGAPLPVATTPLPTETTTLPLPLPTTTLPLPLPTLPQLP